MRNETKRNKTARSDGETRKPRRGREKSPQYTARQREQVRKGLRILAKVIVRAHLRKQAELADSE